MVLVWADALGRMWLWETVCQTCRVLSLWHAGGQGPIWLQIGVARIAVEMLTSLSVGVDRAVRPWEDGCAVF